MNMYVQLHVGICMYMCLYTYVCVYGCMYVFLYTFRYICLLIFVSMYVQVSKFHVRVFIFEAIVFIHLCLLYSLTTCIYYDTSQ